jgi:hypothetical protein
MDIKHASACALEFLSFFSFLNKQPLKVSRKYMCQALELNKKYILRIVQPKSTVVNSKYGLHDQHFTSCKSHTP